MSKARDLADSVSTGGILEDGAVSVSEISDLTVTAAELNNVAGVNSDVQTQLDLKAPLASPTFTGDATFDTDTLVIDSTNNYVGVGTSSPQSELHVSSPDFTSIRLSNDTVGNTISDGLTISMATSGNVSINNKENASMLFYTNNSARMTIDSSGNVGVGTTLPSSALDVDVSQNAETNIELTNTNTGSAAQVRTKYTTDGGLFTVGKTSDAHAFGGDAYLYNVDNTNIRFATNDTERFRIGSSGELGIGGATYGTSGQVLTSGGSGAAPTWADAAAGSGTITATADGAISAGDAVVLQSNGTVKAVQETVTEQTPLIVGFNSNVITISPNNIDYGFGGNMHYHEDTKTVFYFWNTGGDVYMTSMIYDSNNDTWSTRQSNVFIGDGFAGQSLTSDYNPSTGYVLVAWKDSTGYSRLVALYVYTSNNLFQYAKTSQTQYTTVRASGQEQMAIASSTTDNHFRFAWMENNSTLQCMTFSVSGTTSPTLSNVGYAQVSPSAIGNSEYLSMAWDSNNNRFLVVLRNGAVSDYGYYYYFSTSTSNGAVTSHATNTFYNSGYINYSFVEFNPQDACFVVMFDYASGAGIKQLDVSGSSISVVGGSTTVVNIDGWHSQWYRDMRYDSASKKIVYGRRSLGASTNMIVGRITTSGSSPTAANTESDLYTSVNTGEALAIVSMPNVSKFAGIIEPNSGNIQIKAFQSATTSSNNADWIGFASEAISNAASGDILVVGSTDENQSGLTAGSTYYVQTDGSLATTTTDAIKVGRALSATKLLITEGNA